MYSLIPFLTSGVNKTLMVKRIVLLLFVRVELVIIKFIQLLLEYVTISQILFRRAEWPTTFTTTTSTTTTTTKTTCTTSTTTTTTTTTSPTTTTQPGNFPISSKEGDLSKYQLPFSSLSKVELFWNIF